VSSENDRIVFDSSPDGILLIDAEGEIRRVNPQAERLFGYDSGTLVGRRIEELVPAEYRGMHRDHRDRYISHPSVRPMGIGMELQALRRDGVSFPVEVSLAPVETKEGRWVMATVRDVTLRKRLRDFGAGALRATEDERARIARELHDDTAQRLATILVRLRLLERRVTDDDILARMDEIRDAIQDTAEGVRRIARGLRPPELEDAGLESAVRANARRLRDGRGMEVEVRMDPVDRHLTPDGKLVVYRIVQEALNNVARHAHVPRARVEIREEKGTITCVVEDEGQGFTPDDTSLTGRGMGILGMQERAAMLGGDVSVESHPGEGTRVIVRIPVEFEAEVGRV
jgi:PAS domain S-box-containing protein